MPRKSITLFAMLMATIVLFPGCKKEKTAELAATQVASGMLCFNSPEDFAETQQKVLAMSETERREWEQQQGFKSYATKCYELLEDFEAKGVKSDEDIINFVKKNSDYFYIREEGGDKYLSSYLEETPFNYLANEKQMLQIGDMCAKAFNEGAMWIKSDNVSVLNAITYYDNQRQREGLTCFDTEKILPEKFVEDIHHSFEQPSKKDYPYNNDDQWKDTDTDTYKSYISQRITHHNWFYMEANRNVTKSRASGISVYDQVLGGYVFIFTYETLIVPYHRVSGIWYRCQRNTSYDISSSWNIPLDSQCDYHNKGTGSGFLTTVFHYSGPEHPYIADGFKINAFSGWSSTLDTPKLTFPRIKTN